MKFMLNLKDMVLNMKKANPLVSDDSIAAILEIASAYQKSKILLTACELDIFTVLGNDTKTSKQVSTQLDTDERATDRLMDALCSIRLLVKKGNTFSNTKGTRRFLVRGKPEYIGDMMHVSHLWDKWGTLTEAVKLGTATDFKNINEKGDDWIESFIDSMHWRASMQAPDIVRMINLHNVKTILDLGCGSGLYSIEFARVKPGLKISAFDYPKVIKQANKHITREGLSEQIETVEGDFQVDGIGAGYDLVFLSSVIHFYSLWDNIHLLQKIYDSLNYRGQVVIQDFLVNDDRISPEHTAMYSLNMLINTKAGDVYTETEIWIMLKEAWFTDVRRVDTPFGTSLVFGTK